MVRELLTASWERTRSGFVRAVAVDIRALAAVRIACGALLLIDLAYRSVHLRAFYTDAGVLPSSALATLSPWYGHVSVHALSGALWFQVMLFLVAGVAALALLVGYRTKLATALSFVLLASLLARNPVILHSGDSLLLLVLFWGLFLPLGACWGFDARRGPPPVRRVADLAAAALLVQVVTIYTINAVFKLRSDVWRSGEAMAIIYNTGRYTTPVGDLLVHFPGMLGVAGYLWIGLLASSILLVLTHGRMRTLLVALFFAAHLTMLVTMRLGLFPIISMAALLPFLPTPVWDALDRSRVASSWCSAGPKDLGGPFTPLRLWDRSVKPVFMASCLALMLLWGGLGLGLVDAPETARSLTERHAGGWAMFATPGRDEVWYVAVGTTETGETWDPLHDGPVQFETVQQADHPFPDIRWRKYLAVAGPAPELRGALAEHLCGRQAADGAGFVEVTVHRLEQASPLDGPHRPIRSEALGTYRCAD